MEDFPPIPNLWEFDDGFDGTAPMDFGAVQGESEPSFNFEAEAQEPSFAEQFDGQMPSSPEGAGASAPSAAGAEENFSELCAPLGVPAPSFEQAAAVGAPVHQFVPAATHGAAQLAVAPVSVAISTLTIFLKLTIAGKAVPVDLAIMAKHMPLVSGSIVFDPRSRAFKDTKGNTVKSFGNQARLSVRIGGHSFTALIFSNGTVKLLGCATEAEGKAVARKVLQIVRCTSCVDPMTGAKVFAVPNPRCVRVSDFDVKMRKGDAEVGFGVKLPFAMQALRNAHIETDFRPESFGGLLAYVKCGPKVTVTLWPSGKACVAGNCTEEEAARAAGIVVGVIHADAANCRNDNLPVTRRRRPAPRRQRQGSVVESVPQGAAPAAPVAAATAATVA